jgi:arginyl-tRNA synthetase
MYRKLNTEIKNSVNNAINQLGWDLPTDISIEEPPRPDMGDIATSVAFELAGKLKRSPVEISKELADVIAKPTIFKKVLSVGPYLNFFIDYQKYSELVLNSINEDYGQLELKNDRIILEHTSANPNGPLHIGHIRNSILGDSLSRVLKKAGYDVETQYYVNDMGRQIAMVVWGLLNLQFDVHKLDSASIKNPETDPYQKIETIIGEHPEFNKLEDNYLNGLRNILYLQIFVENNLRDHKIGELYFQVNQELKNNPELKSSVDELLRVYGSVLATKYRINGDTVYLTYDINSNLILSDAIVGDKKLSELIPSKYKRKVYCMHIDSNELIAKAKEEGFNVVESVTENNYYYG